MKKKDLLNCKNIHLTGIKGVGMTALALAFRDLGMNISGSDTEELFVTDKILKKEQINWHKGFKAANINKKPDLLIYTAAHKGKANIEVQTALKKNIPCLSHARALGMLMKNKIGISVAGVGGKTTTTSLISYVLKYAKLNPSYVIGSGLIKPLGNPGKYAINGRYFVAEADEYCISPQDKRPRFFYQQPKILILTNIAWDHPDVYPNIKATIAIFTDFINRLPKDSCVILNGDNLNNRKIIKKIKRTFISYGFNKNNHWQITILKEKENQIDFNLKNKHQLYHFVLGIPGAYNAANATAAAICARLCGIDGKIIKKALAKFKGVERRMEVVAKIGNKILIDDYGHHPTEIKAVISSIKKRFKQKIITIFQPHTYSRTKALFKDFSASFKDADMAFFAPVYASAREKKDPKINSIVLAAAVNKVSKNGIYVDNAKSLGQKIASIKGAAVIVTLGAGDIFLWHKEIIKAMIK